jgi:four helix bundle protein
MKSCKDLDVFQQARRLAIEIPQLSLSLLKFELYEEGSQIRRSSKAVASLIVEGYGRRRYKPDFIKYLVYSHAECDETFLHPDFLVATGSLQSDGKLNSLLEELPVA